MFKRTALAGIMIIIALSGILSGCGGAKPGTYTPSAAWCQGIADKIKTVQPVDIPGSLAQDGSPKTGDEFNVNDYFPVLTHLSMNSGYVLDYLYFISGDVATPLLYTRYKDQPPYTLYQEYFSDGTSITRPENDVTLIWISRDKNQEVKYGSQIAINKSPEGYYEYTVLQLLGGQFYLFYKANQYDVRIVCQSDKVEQILGEIDGSDMTPIDETFKTAARALDLQPVVEIGEDSVTVSLVIFTKWGGFSRVHYTIGGDYPNSITKYENTNLLAYDCGITL